MKLMVALIISLLVEELKPGLPNKSVLTTAFSFSATILTLILFSFFKRVVKFGQWRKNFFSIRVFFTDTDNSQDSRERERNIFYSTLPLPTAHKR